MNGPGPTHFTFGREAAAQVARQVRYVERLPRNKPVQRRRSVAAASGSPIAFATLNATLNPSSSASATFNLGGSGPVTVYDAGLLCSGDSVTSGTLVVIAKIGGKWYVIQTRCGC